jgi:uncharacterized protein
MPLLICPNCNVGMTQVNRSGVELDMCPQCRGVWLDRGELEKLLEPFRSEARQEAPPAPRNDYYRGDDHHRGHDDHHSGHGQYGRKRNSILDIFD